MKPNPIISLIQSRKSIVGGLAIALMGLVYFFGYGTIQERIDAATRIAGLAVAVIVAIAHEDAAEKSATVVVDHTDEGAPLQ